MSILGQCFINLGWIQGPSLGIILGSSFKGSRGSRNNCFLSIFRSSGKCLWVILTHHHASSIIHHHPRSSQRQMSILGNFIFLGWTQGPSRGDPWVKFQGSSGGPEYEKIDKFLGLREHVQGPSRRSPGVSGRGFSLPVL